MNTTPMIFNGDMVRALLEGRKTQTRRPVKARKDIGVGCVLMPHEIAGEVNAGDYLNSIYGEPGDLLWVRETWNKTNPCGAGVPYYRADGRCPESIGGRAYVGDESWKPSIHMPRWASRLTLRLTSVRIERVQDITEDDATREGVSTMEDAAKQGATWYDKPKRAYQFLWNNLYGNWNENPWVWVLGFEVLNENIDAVLRRVTAERAA